MFIGHLPRSGDAGRIGHGGSVARNIPDYNFWDFYVTLQMTKADNCPLIMRWFPDSTPEERDKMLVDMAVNWLDDPDNKNAGHKIWSYLN